MEVFKWLVIGIGSAVVILTIVLASLYVRGTYKACEMANIYFQICEFYNIRPDKDQFDLMVAEWKKLKRPRPEFELYIEPIIKSIRNSMLDSELLKL